MNIKKITTIMFLLVLLLPSISMAGLTGSGDSFSLKTDYEVPNANFSIGAGNGNGGFSHQAIVWTRDIGLNLNGFGTFSDTVNSHLWIAPNGNVRVKNRLTLGNDLYLNETKAISVDANGTICLGAC